MPHHTYSLLKCCCYDATDATDATATATATVVTELNCCYNPSILSYPYMLNGEWTNKKRDSSKEIRVIMVVTIAVYPFRKQPHIPQYDPKAP